MATKTTGTPRTRKTKTNVASLFGQAVRGVVKADPEIIRHLEELLEKARGGLFSGLAYATVEANGSTGSGWAGDANFSETLGAVSRLQYRMLKRDDE